ncbi:tRNA glutamyl-Q(34) synthetase GluQRS [uncultured Megasphaera sp.]|uniref:tRNA glutamyl-Q(34) synthetase GluQRS n=1 Tax=uncultured Megasphaera sp. TaxID=165188 RepID=UPI002659DA7B|nr:tRNA glutamyl-Q(34) synthetase GluQRS [uncultured Megasphaera sp.]
MRGRFAPSPTGYIHLGNVWTAFLCWLQVRQAGGTLVLRIEDIDEQRSKPVFEQALLEDLRWLGLTWDEGPDAGGACGPYVQQQRYDFYAACLQSIQERGLLYPCYCSRARLQAIGAPHAGEHTVYDGHCYGLTDEERRQMKKAPSFRIHVPPRHIAFSDGIYGRQEAFLPTSCGDFVLRRADGLYAYQLAVSADDGAMAITHVLRGRDLLSSTAQQIWLMELLGYTPPVYTHVPMLIDGQGQRLSKRQHGITVRELRSHGVTAAQVLSYLAWKGGLLPDPAVYSLDELLHYCDLQRLGQKDIRMDDDVYQAITAFT